MSTRDNLVYPEVLEGYLVDVGQGIARLDAKSMRDLGVKEGDHLFIQAKRKTLAKCKKLLDADEVSGEDYSGYVRIDGLIRNNAGADIGDTITVFKATTLPAQKVIVTPLEDKDELLEKIRHIDVHYLADCLNGIPLINGDNIMVTFSDEKLFFNVIETFPKDIPIEISKNTIFHIEEHPLTQRNPNDNKFLEILKERYAKGEITREEFYRMKDDLKD